MILSLFPAHIHPLTLARDQDLLVDLNDDNVR